MAKIQAPEKKKSIKGAPLPEITASTNLTKAAPGRMVHLNFTVPSEFRKEYKNYALERDLSMIELFYETFEFYKQHKGIK